MGATLRIVSGHSAGATVELLNDAVVAGRHPDAGLRFDADRDLTVSSRHCEFVCTSGTWSVRDLGSRNGTFVNDSPIDGDVMLRPGDIIMLGPDGPCIAFEEHAGAVTAAVAPPHADTLHVDQPYLDQPYLDQPYLDQPYLDQPHVDPLREDTGVRVRVAVRRATRKIRITAAALITCALLVLGGVYAADRRERATWEAERATLRLRVDSLIATGRQAEAALQQEVAGLTTALRASENRLRQLQADIGASRGDGPRVERLERQLLSASAALRRQQLAASLDYGLIQRRNRAAVAMIWVEYTNGTRVTGTAVAVRDDGLLLTNRHLVRGTDGAQTVRRIVVRFADSEQAFPGRVAAVARDWDIAVLRVSNVLGAIPTVGAFNARADTIAPGAPVALIGFPLAGEPDPDGAGARRVARPVVSAGLVVGNDASAIEVQGLGAAGGSGSPIIDAQGEVVGVLYGGRTDAGVQLLMAVPAGAVLSFLSRIP